MKRLIASIITLFMLLTPSYAIRLPNVGPDDQSLQEYVGTLSEDDIEGSRAENPRRRASENKKPWQGEDLWDMEDRAWPPHDSRFINWPPIPPLGAGYPPPEIPSFPDASCLFSQGPNQITNTESSFIQSFVGVRGVITSVVMKGPATWQYIGTPALALEVTPLANASDGSILEFTAIVQSEIEPEVVGFCTKIVYVNLEDEVEDCDRTDDITVVHTDGDNLIEPSTSETLYVSSGGLGCNPYDWSIVGTGYTIDITQTANDNDTVTVTAGAGGCGGGTSATVEVTAIDQNGNTDTHILLLNAGGANWVLQNTYNTNDTANSCSIAAGVPTPGSYGGEIIGDQWWEVINSAGTWGCACKSSGWRWVEGGVEVPDHLKPPGCTNPQDCSVSGLPLVDCTARPACGSQGCVSRPSTARHYHFECP